MDILRVVHDGAFLPTQIMYRANLAWVSLQNCLGSLVRTGLLERVAAGSKRSYQLTQKGREILNSFNEILDAVKTQEKLQFGAG